MTLRHRAFVVSLTLLFTFAMQAATLTWTGAANNLWSNPANWQEGVAPQSGDSLVFPSGGLNQAMQNDLPAGTTLASLTFPFGSNSYSVSGNIVQITGTVSRGTFQSGIRVMANDARVAATSIPGTLDANGKTFFLGESGAGVTLSGSLIGTGTIRLAASPQVLSGSGTFSGTFVSTNWCRCGDQLYIDGSYPSANFDIAQPIFGTGTVGTLRTSGGINGALKSGNLTLRTSDQMDSTGVLSVRLTNSMPPTVDVHGTVTLQNAPIYVTADPGFTPSAGTEYVIIRNDGVDPVVGTLGYTNNMVTYQPYPEGSTVYQSGPYAYRITYHGGDGNDVALVAVAPTSTAILSDSPDPSVYGQSVTVIVEVTSSNGTPTGTVTLYGTPTSGGSQVEIGTASVDATGRATFVTNSLDRSMYLRAVYNGAGGFGSSTSPTAEHTVQRAQTTITASAPSSPAGQPATVNVSVRAASPGSGTPAGTVSIFKDTTQLGTATLDGNGDASVTISGLPAGTHTLTAQYTGNSNFAPSQTTFSYTATETATPPSITARPEKELEGNDGLSPVSVTVQLTSASSQRVMVDYRTRGGDATPGSDYMAASGTLTFEPGETSKAIVIQIIGDITPEQDEQFFVSFSNPRGATLSTNSVVVTIVSDDPDYDATVNLTYAEAAGQPLTLDLYVPRTSSGLLPLIVALNTKEWMEHGPATDMLLRQTARGYAVALVRFRSASQGAFPAQIEDVKAAVRWLRTNAARFNLDAARFGAIGIDSGAHLASLLGTTGDGVFHDAALGNPTASSSVRSVVALYGASDLLALATDPTVCDGGTQAAISRLLGCAAQTCPDKARDASPITYAGEGNDAAFLLMHGTADCTVPFSQSQRFYDALRASGADATLLRLEGGGHGGSEWSAQPVQDAVDAFLDRTLRAPVPSRRRSVSH